MRPRLSIVTRPADESWARWPLPVWGAMPATRASSVAVNARPPLSAISMAARAGLPRSAANRANDAMLPMSASQFHNHVSGLTVESANRTTNKARSVGYHNHASGSGYVRAGSKVTKQPFDEPPMLEISTISMDARCFMKAMVHAAALLKLYIDGNSKPGGLQEREVPPSGFG